MWRHHLAFKAGNASAFPAADSQLSADLLWSLSEVPERAECGGAADKTGFLSPVLPLRAATGLRPVNGAVVVPEGPIHEVPSATWTSC